MADTDVTIKDGAVVDRKIDTRTVGAGADEHRQVFVVGDPVTAANVAVVTADGALTVIDSRPGTATLANVSASITSVTLQASNVARRGLCVYNDSTSVMYLKFGSAASATSYTLQMGPGGYYELPLPVYSGIVTGVWVSAVGTARVTELT
jgi:hypothetical protein